MTDQPIDARAALAEARLAQIEDLWKGRSVDNGQQSVAARDLRACLDWVLPDGKEPDDRAVRGDYWPVPERDLAAETATASPGGYALDPRQESADDAR